MKPSVLDKIMCDSDSSLSCDSNVRSADYRRAVTEKLESHADFVNTDFCPRQGWIWLLSKSRQLLKC